MKSNQFLKNSPMFDSYEVVREPETSAKLIARIQSHISLSIDSTQVEQRDALVHVQELVGELTIALERERLVGQLEQSIEARKCAEVGGQS